MWLITGIISSRIGRIILRLKKSEPTAFKVIDIMFFLTSQPENLLKEKGEQQCNCMYYAFLFHSVIFQFILLYYTPFHFTLLYFILTGYLDGLIQSCTIIWNCTDLVTLLKLLTQPYFIYGYLIETAEYTISNMENQYFTSAHTSESAHFERMPIIITPTEYIMYIFQTIKSSAGRWNTIYAYVPQSSQYSYVNYLMTDTL